MEEKVNKKRGILNTLFFVALALLVSAPGLVAGSKTALQIFFTSDLYGYLKPCG